MKREYKVVGEQVVHGNPPGSTFTASFTPEHEAFLVEAGHVKVVDRKKED